MSLREWFGKGSKGDWVDIGAPKKDGEFQPCGRSSTKSSKRKYPKCVPRSEANNMTASERTSAVKRKRSRKQGVGGKPTNVKTFAKDGCFVTKRNHRGCGAVMPGRRKKTRYS